MVTVTEQLPPLEHVKKRGQGWTIRSPKLSGVTQLSYSSDSRKDAV